MNDIPITANFGTLPPGYKPSDWQDLVTKLEAIFNAYLPGSYKPVNYGSTTPAAEDQDRPWVRTNGDGSPDRTYVFFNGKWVARHPVDPASDERRMWVGTLVGLRSHDGGDGTTDVPTATTGAMWEEDTAFRDKIPMGVLDATGQVQTPLATAGALTDSITLTVDQIPRHRHEITVEASSAAESTGELYDADSTGVMKSDSGVELGWDAGDSRNVVGFTRYYGDSAASEFDVDTLPPVIGVFVIKRSARYFWTP